MEIKANKKEPKGSMLSDVAFVSASKVVTYAISLVSAMLLARFRTLSEYGTYSQIMLVINLATTLFMMGLPSCIIYFLSKAETKEQRNKFLSIYYIFNTFLSFMVGLILVLIIPLIEMYFNNNDIVKYFFFLALFPWTTIITSSIENLLIVHKKSKLLIGYRVSHSLMTVVVILFIQLMNWPFISYMILYLAFEILFTFFVYLIAIRLDGKFSFKIDWSLVKEILAFSIPLGLSNASSIFNSEMDKFIIGFHFSTEEYAIYANAAKEMPITFLTSSITMVLIPIIIRLVTKGAIKGALKLWHDTTILGYLINSFFAIGLFVFSKEAIVFLYSSKYESGFLIFGIYSLVLLLRCTNFGLFLQATGNTKIILKSTVLSLVINFVLSIVLLNIIGFPGPAVATVLSIASMHGYMLYHVSKVTKSGIKNVFPWKKLLQITLVNVILGIIFFFIKTFVPLEKFISSSGEAFVFAGCWLAIYLFIFRKLIKEKLSIIKNQK